MSDSPKPKLTEKIVAGLLRDKLTKTGNGGSGEYAFFTQVRSGAAFDSKRTFDGLSMSLWPSRGLSIVVYEIKVSRSDWLREMKKPEKAEDACQIADQFVIVAPAGCVKDGELPPTWGLIEVTGDGADKPWKLRTVTAAPMLHDEKPTTKPMTRSFVVGLLRAVPGAVPGGRVVDDLTAAVNAARHEGFVAGQEQEKRVHEQQAMMANRDLEDWLVLRRKLMEAGVDRYAAGPAHLGRHAEVIAEALREGKVNTQRAGLVDRLKSMLDELDPGWRDT